MIKIQNVLCNNCVQLQKRVSMFPCNSCYLFYIIGVPGSEILHIICMLQHLNVPVCLVSYGRLLSISSRKSNFSKSGSMKQKMGISQNEESHDILSIVFYCHFLDFLKEQTSKTGLLREKSQLTDLCFLPSVVSLATIYGNRWHLLNRSTFIKLQGYLEQMHDCMSAIACANCNYF